MNDGSADANKCLNACPNTENKNMFESLDTCEYCTLASCADCRNHTHCKTCATGYNIDE